MPSEPVMSALGDVLAADAPAGAESLTVVDVGDFSAAGGSLKVGGEVVAYTAVDGDTGIITLGVALAQAYVIGDRVELYPAVYAETDQVVEVSPAVLADLAVTTQKLADAAVVTGKIADSAVTGTKIVADAVTARELAALSVTTEKLAVDAVAAGKITADAVTAREIQALAVTAAKIAAEAVTAAKVAAGAISTEKLSVGVQRTLSVLPNGDMEEASTLTDTGVAGWQKVTGTAVVTQDTASPLSGSASMKVVLPGQTDTQMVRQSEAFPVNEGETWYMAVRAKTDRAVASSIALRLYALTSPDATFSMSTAVAVMSVAATRAAQLLEGQIVIPVGHKFLRFRLNNTSSGDGAGYTCWWDGAQLSRLLTGVQIANGAVTALKLSGDAIDGKVITGATVQSEAAESRGVKVTSAGVEGFSPSGTRVVFIAAATGRIVAVGEVATGEPGQPRVRLVDSTALGTHQASAEFHTKGAGEALPGRVTAESDVDGSYFTLRLMGALKSAWASIRPQVLLEYLSSESRVYLTANRVLLSAGSVLDLQSGAMGTGSVGTGTFRDSVDARADNRIAAARTRGAITVALDAAGDGVVTHGLGTTPTAVLVTSNGAAWWGIVTAKNATTFTMRCYSATGTILTSVSRSVAWEAIA